MKKFETTLQPVSELVIPIDKLSNLLFNTDKLNESRSFKLVEDKKQDITSPVIIVFPKDNNGNDITLTPFDKLIFTAALSEQLAGNEFVSYRRIFRAIGGGHDLKNHAYRVQAAIEYSFWKLRHTDLTINLSDVVGKRKKYAEKLSIDSKSKNKPNIKWRGVLLPTETVTATVNGTIADGVVRFLDTSILFDIADLKNQIARCNINLLDAPVRNTEQTLTLKFYLLERILKIEGSNDENRKHVTKLSNTILFETLYNQCGLQDADKWKKQDFRKTIAQILDFFKDQNFISDYTFVQENGKFSAIEIKY